MGLKNNLFIFDCSQSLEVGLDESLKHRFMNP